MSELFESLPEEKKKRIIDACIEEFADKGYEKASTNAIVKRAGVSKGILFHYFGSKKNVFLYVVDYTMDYSLKKYYALSAERPSDIFERMVWASLFKIKMLHEDPLIFKLFFNAFINIPDELKKELGDRHAKLNKEHMPSFFEGIDTSKFRSDIDPNKAIEIVMLFLDGLSQKYINKFKGHTADEILGSMSELMDEFNEYFNILRGGIYNA